MWNTFAWFIIGIGFSSFTALTGNLLKTIINVLKVIHTDIQETNHQIRQQTEFMRKSLNEL